MIEKHECLKVAELATIQSEISSLKKNDDELKDSVEKLKEKLNLQETSSALLQHSFGRFEKAVEHMSDENKEQFKLILTEIAILKDKPAERWNMIVAVGITGVVSMLISNAGNIVQLFT